MKAYLTSYMFSHGSTPSLKARKECFIEALSSYLFQNQQIKTRYRVEQMGFDGKSAGYALCSTVLDGVRGTRILKVGFQASKTREPNEYKLNMHISCTSYFGYDDKLCPLEIIEALEKSDNPKVSSAWLQHTKEQHAQKALKSITKKGQLFIRRSDAPLLPKPSINPHFAIYEGKGTYRALTDQGWVEVKELQAAQTMEPMSKEQLPAIEHHVKYEVQSGILFEGTKIIGRLPTSKERQDFISARLTATQARASMLHIQHVATFTSGQWFN